MKIPFKHEIEFLTSFTVKEELNWLKFMADWVVSDFLSEKKKKSFPQITEQ